MTYFPIDLHTHSTASDGKLSPTDLVILAASQQMQAIALTDHDTAAGLDEALTAGKTYQLTVIPGIEFSTRHEYDKGFVGVHLLGYFIEHHQPHLITVVEQVQKARLEQKIKQIEKLQSYGFDIPVEAVLAATTGVPGRPHIAAVLMARHPGRFETVQQVFDEYLGVHSKAHVRRSFALTVGEAVEVVIDAGGLPVLAHPGSYSSGVDVKTLIKNAVAAGIKGVEVYYPYPPGQGGGKLVAQIEAIAHELKLLKTGGSDYHARPDDPVQLGDMGLSLTDFEKLTRNL